MAPPPSSASKRRRRTPVECFIAKLPETLLAEIFLYLPIATLMRCRRVCKSWRSVLSSPAFNQLRLDRRPFSDVVICRSRKKFFFYEGREMALAAVSVLEKSSFLASRCSVLHLVNSCNGLVCMIRCSGTGNRSNPCSLKHRRCHGNAIFVVNPVTSEYVSLPSSPKGMKMEMCALGFCTKTNQFKAFRILSQTNGSQFSPFPNWESDDDDEGEKSEAEKNSRSDSEESQELSGLYLQSDDEKSYVVEVCTLGTGTWRRIEVDLHSLKQTFLRYEVCYSFTYVNGSVYWIAEWNDHPEVASFDFESERFRRVTQGHFYSDVLGIGAFREDCLYLCRLEDIDFEAIAIANKDKDVAAADDNLNEGDRGVEVFLFKNSWTEETVIKIPKALKLGAYGYPVVKYFENGNILFWRNMGLHLFGKEEQRYVGFASCDMRSAEDVIVHVPSFLSLKDMVEGGSLEVRNVGLKNAKA